MNGKDLTKQNSYAAPDLEARLAGLRKDLIASEERAIRTACAKTNDIYVVKFKRKAECEPFTVSGIAKEPPPKPQGGVFGSFFAKPAAPPQHFDWDEFDFHESCPGCGDHSGKTSCSGCGRLMCNGNSPRIDGRRKKFFCHPDCGSSFYTKTATSIEADASCHPVLPSPDKRKALEAPRLRLTGRR